MWRQSFLDFNFKTLLLRPNVRFRSKWIKYQLRKEIEEFMYQQTLNNLKAGLIAESKKPDGLTRALKLFDKAGSQDLMTRDGTFSADEIDGGSILETIINRGFERLVKGDSPTWKRKYIQNIRNIC